MVMAEMNKRNNKKKLILDEQITPDLAVQPKLNRDKGCVDIFRG